MATPAPHITISLHRMANITNIAEAAHNLIISEHETADRHYRRVQAVEPYTAVYFFLLRAYLERRIRLAAAIVRRLKRFNNRAIHHIIRVDGQHEADVYAHQQWEEMERLATRLLDRDVVMTVRVQVVSGRARQLRSQSAGCAGWV